MTAPENPGQLAVTTGGLPYPVSTAPANQGANDIKALALALESRGAGKLTQTGHPSQTFTLAASTITFPVPFKAGTVPLVLAQGGAGSTVNNAALLVSVISATATTCQVIGLVVSGVGAASAWAPAGFVCEVNYVAIGESAS